VSAAHTVRFSPSPASSEAQASALARIYDRAIQRFQEKKGGPTIPAPDDAKELERRRLCRTKT
jgi:hypothetical protein